LVETWVNAAGTVGSAGDGGAALAATLNGPNGLLVYNGDTLLVAEMGGDVIRAVDLNTRTITRWAGTGSAGATVDGIHRLAAMLNNPHGLAVLPDNSVLIASYGVCRIVRVTAAGVTRLFAGAGTCSSTGNGGSALSATLHGPVGVAVDNSTGTVYWGELGGHRVRVCGGRGGGGWRGCTLWQRPQTAMRARLITLQILPRCASSPSQCHNA
jgi:DNA-binding beta-propeller fold protein YncE